MTWALLAIACALMFGLNKPDDITPHGRSVFFGMMQYGFLAFVATAVLTEAL